MYKKACILCLYTDLLCIRGIFVWKLRFWRIFVLFKNLSRLKVLLTHPVKKNYAGSRKKGHWKWLRKIFTSYPWKTGLSRPCWRGQWCVGCYCRGMVCLTIQCCLYSFPLRETWCATNDLFLQWIFQDQNSLLFTTRVGLSLHACVATRHHK